MVQNELYRQFINELFHVLRRNPPAITGCEGLTVSLQGGAGVQVQKLGGQIALSASIDLPVKCSEELLLELLQVNMDIASSPIIVVSALVESRKAVIWGKLDLEPHNRDGFVGFFERFSFYAEAIIQMVGRSSQRKPPRSRAPEHLSRANLLFPSQQTLLSQIRKGAI